MGLEIFVGYDKRQPEAFAGCRESAQSKGYRAQGICIREMRERGLYTRPTLVKENGNLWDIISDAPMATEFSNSRFLTSHLASRSDHCDNNWALFMDCDMMWRADPHDLHMLLNPQYAVMCVKHNYNPAASAKMDGQVQTQYNRKLWSSLMAINMDHPANDQLTLEMINTLPGRDLHQFVWLTDDEIGALPEEWNYIPGHSPADLKPKVIHWTEGGPWLDGFENVPYADEWRAYRSDWLSC